LINLCFIITNTNFLGPRCPHLETVNEDPDMKFDDQDPCKECGNIGENWFVSFELQI